jgi:hypothetical protein
MGEGKGEGEEYMADRGREKFPQKSLKNLKKREPL